MIQHLFLMAFLLTAAAGNQTAGSTNSSLINSTPQATPSTAFVSNFTGAFVGNFSIVAGAQYTPPVVPPATAIGQILNTIFGTSNAAFNVLIQYGYTPLFIMMVTDSAGLPPPSEFIMPPAGFLARNGYINFAIAYLVLLVANIIGITIAYYIGLHFGERFLLRHHRVFRIKAHDLRVFQEVFRKEEDAIVFIGRLVPLLRTVISFVAGFSRMPLKKYYMSSIAGAMVYNYMLMLSGYYLVSESGATSMMLIIGIILIITYTAYKLVFSGMEKGSKRNSGIKGIRMRFGAIIEGRAR